MRDSGNIDWLIPVVTVATGLAAAAITATLIYCFTLSPLKMQNVKLQGQNGKLSLELVKANGELTNKTMDPEYTREQRIQRFTAEVSRRNVEKKNRRDLLGQEEKEGPEIELVEDYSGEIIFPDPKEDPTQDSTVGTSGDVKLDIPSPEKEPDREFYNTEIVEESPSNLDAIDTSVGLDIPSPEKEPDLDIPSPEKEPDLDIPSPNVGFDIHSPFEPITWEGPAGVCVGLSILAFFCFFFLRWLWRRMRRLPIPFFKQKKEVPPAGSKLEQTIGNVFSSSTSSVVRNLSLAKQLFGYVTPGFTLTQAIAPFASTMAFSILFVS